MSDQNLLDRMIGYVSPARAKKRAVERLQNEQLRRYEAAGGGRRWDSGYLSTNASANSELERAAPKIRDRHRLMVRNNPWAARAIQAITTNTVGFGITGELARRGKRNVSQAIKDQWTEYCDTPAMVDAYGQHDLYGLQAIAMRTTAEAGDCLAIRVRQPGGFSRIKLIEPDHLDHTKNSVLPDGGRVVQGVEYSRRDEIVAYWLYPQHPGDTHTQIFQPRRFPASDVLHVYRVDRPGQSRGVAWGHAVMLSLRDLDGYEDAYLFRQKLANCVAGIAEDIDPMGLQSGQAQSIPAESLEPGAILHAPPGKRINWSTPPNAGDYGPFTRDILLRVAAGYGISYQALTGDLSSVNFSSGRMGWVEFQRNLEAWRWQMLIPMFCDRIAGWWLEDAALMGANVDGIFAEWTPPRREMFDPTREGPAMRDLVRSGLKSLQATHREMGMRTQAVLKEMSEDMQLIDQYGLVLDSDPRKVSASGLTQARPDGSILPPVSIEEQANEAED